MKKSLFSLLLFVSVLFFESFGQSQPRKLIGFTASVGMHTTISNFSEAEIYNIAKIEENLILPNHPIFDDVSLFNIENFAFSTSKQLNYSSSVTPSLGLIFDLSRKKAFPLFHKSFRLGIGHSSSRLMHMDKSEFSTHRISDIWTEPTVDSIYSMEMKIQSVVKQIFIDAAYLFQRKTETGAFNFGFGLITGFGYERLTDVKFQENIKLENTYTAIPYFGIQGYTNTYLIDFQSVTFIYNPVVYAFVFTPYVPIGFEVNLKRLSYKNTNVSVFFESKIGYQMTYDEGVFFQNNFITQNIFGVYIRP